MADVRESFPNLEGASGEGLALRSVQQGESVASKNGQLAFGFMDASGNAKAAPIKTSGAAPGDAVPVMGFLNSAGNLAYPQMNAAGAIPVTSDVGTDLYARGTVAGNASFVDVVTLALTNSKVYQGLEVLVSCFRDAIYEVVWDDDGSETILADAVITPGHSTVMINLSKLEFTSGGTGTQSLIVRAKNLNTTSDFRATVATTEQ